MTSEEHNAKLKESGNYFHETYEDYYVKYSDLVKYRNNTGNHPTGISNYVLGISYDFNLGRVLNNR